MTWDRITKLAGHWLRNRESFIRGPRALRRQTPEVGAVCPNWARTDLCGGREVTRVPTAKVIDG